MVTVQRRHVGPGGYRGWGADCGVRVGGGRRGGRSRWEEGEGAWPSALPLEYLESTASPRGREEGKHVE